MAIQSGIQEAVLLFDVHGAEITDEMLYERFQRLLRQDDTLTGHAASSIKAAYAMVGAGLAVQGLAFFQFRVNEEGYVDPAFNLPLEYMVRNAGEGPDLGAGPINLACRSQCPVPWHSVNLWEPTGQGEAHPAWQVQKALWRNRIGLKPLPVRGTGAQPLAVRNARREPAVRLEASQQGRALVTDDRQRIEEHLTATIGDAGLISMGQYSQQHRSQVNQLADQYRNEMQKQQQGYLDQIRGCRQEIQRLKSLLRNEQERNRRLQELLRGSV